jgi:flagellar biosynthesis protein FlhG
VVEKTSEEAPRVVAFGSGKGGVGKSLLAANVGVFLATLGKRVVLVDAAFGSANLHSFVGVAEPQRTLADMLVHRGFTLDKVVAGTAVPGLEIVAGRHDPAWTANPRARQLARLRDQLRKLTADYVVIDCASGTGTGPLDLLLLADNAVVVLSPEPSSVELGYRLLRAMFLRRMRQLALHTELRLDDSELRSFAGGIPSPLDLYRRALDSGQDELAKRLKAEMLNLRPQLLFNNVRSKSDMDLGRAMAGAVRRVIGLPVRYLGYLEYDDAVWVALRRGRSLLIEHPESRVAKCIEKVTRGLLARESEPIVADILSGESFYDLLDIEPTASDEEIRRANRRMRQFYGRDSILVRGLYTRDRLEEMNRRLDEAYETLMDPARRKSYDLELFPEGIPLRSEIRVGKHPEEPMVPPKKPPSELPPMPEISNQTEFTGTLMQQIREARGLDLREIAERTKIGIGYLESIENESYTRLPAMVYVRGFLTEYAKMLDIDVNRVLDSYLPRYRRVREAEAPD